MAGRIGAQNQWFTLFLGMTENDINIKIKNSNLVMKIKVNLLQRAYQFFEKYRDLMTPSEVSAIYSIMSDYCLKGQTPDLTLNHDNLPILLMWEIMKATIDKALVEDQEIVEEPKPAKKARRGFNEKPICINGTPVAGLTKYELRYLNCLKEAKEHNIVYNNDYFRCSMKDLRKATGTDSSTCTSIRESLVSKGFIKYNKGERRNDPVFFKLIEQETVHHGPIIKDELKLWGYIRMARNFYPVDQDGYHRAPYSFLKAKTGFSTDKIKNVKENLMEKGYIDCKKDKEGYHVYKILGYQELKRG